MGVFTIILIAAFPFIRGKQITTGICCKYNFEGCNIFNSYNVIGYKYSAKMLIFIYEIRK